MINKNLMFDIAVYFYQNYGISMECLSTRRASISTSGSGSKARDATGYLTSASFS